MEIVRNKILRSPWTAKISLVVLLLLFFAVLQWAPSFADPDSFYHAKTAELMKRDGFIKEFPWLKFSSFSGNFTDQHFLYHLFLVPFAVVFSPLLGTKLAAIFFASAAVVFFYCFLKRWRFRWPLFYVLILLSVPSFVFRLSLAKAGPLSLIILLIGLSLIWQKRHRALGVLSFFYVWTHGGWALMLVLIFSHLAGRFLISRSLEIDWKLPIGVFLGLTAGLIFNPYFPHNLQFYWEQVVQIGLLNYQDIIPVGMEWYPPKLGQFLASNAFGFVLLTAALVAFFWKIKNSVNERTAGQNLSAAELAFPSNFIEGEPASALPTDNDRERLGLARAVLARQILSGRPLITVFQKILTLLIFSGLLFIMTLKSQRYVEYFAPFLVLTGAFLLDFSLPENFSPRAWLEKFFSRNRLNKIIIGYLVFAWLFFFGVKSYELRILLTKGFSWNYLQGAAEWLAQNIPGRGLVFHSGWSDFPMLFFHNDRNVYVAGMDPTFFYRYDRELYLKWADIIRAKVSPMAETIKNDFGADYVLAKHSEAALLEKIRQEPRFVLKYQDNGARVYEIK